MNSQRMWVAPHLTSGLGNRLFQYAAAAGAAERWKRELVFYMPACDTSPHGPMSSILRMFPGVKIVEEPVAELQEYPEPGRRFYEYIPLGPVPYVNSLVKGFRQSPLYFPSQIRPDWDSALGPETRRRIEKLASLHTMNGRTATYAIHVRLGDYKHLKHHQVDLSKYYSMALERIPRNSRLHVFSDEPDICRDLFRGAAIQKGFQLTLAVTHSDVESLYEMSLCLGGTICANSTFSWWGAWFAHENGAAWATFPDSMGAGQPEPVDFYPEWATILKT